MNQSFDQHWNKVYPDLLPLSHLFKYYFSDCWIRLYSFQNGQRYANNDKEMQSLLEFQNEVISECLTPNQPLYIVSHQFQHPTKIIFEQNLNHLPYMFIASSPIYPYQVDSKFYDEDQKDLLLISLATQTIWQRHSHDDLLSQIANDEINAFLMPLDNQVIIAPYDGGIDLIIFDIQLKNQIKSKYLDRISSREDGL